jgi:hypothetical protein
VEVKAGVPEHVASSGPRRSKVSVPVGEKPPERTPVSPIVPPTITDADAWVTRAAVALVTTTLSLTAPHPLATALLAASPP